MTLEIGQKGVPVTYFRKDGADPPIREENAWKKEHPSESMLALAGPGKTANILPEGCQPHSCLQEVVMISEAKQCLHCVWF